MPGPRRSRSRIFQSPERMAYDPGVELVGVSRQRADVLPGVPTSRADPGGQGSSTSASPKRRRERSAARTRSSQSSRCRASTRCGREDPKRRCCRRSRSSGRLRPLQPPGEGFLTGKIDVNTKFDSSDFRTHAPHGSLQMRTRQEILVGSLLPTRTGITSSWSVLAFLVHPTAPTNRCVRRTSATLPT
jgi:hypothetical protein